MFFIVKILALQLKIYSNGFDNSLMNIRVKKVYIFSFLRLSKLKSVSKAQFPTFNYCRFIK